MKRFPTLASLFIVTLLMIGSPAVAQTKADTTVFTVIKEAPITSVKNQNRSSTCWSFSGLGFIEAEILRKSGKTYDLCEQFVIYHTMMDRAVAHVRTHGDVSFSPGGSFYDVLYCLKNYGICPQNAMVPAGSLYGDTLLNHNELDRLAEGYVTSITKDGKLKKISPLWKNGLSHIYESYLGPLPTKFKYEGKTYTPQSFEESLGLDLDDYVSLTSYTHHPFYTQFVLEIQDNWRWATSYNLPLDEFMETMEYAVRNGYTFAWGADVSESYFGRNGISTVPASAKDQSTEGSDQERWIGKTGGKNPTISEKGEKTITQEMRQEAYDNWETTDDHGMLIYGLAKDQNGKEYFMMKNSWGNYGKYHGLGYISKAYVAYKTMNIVLNKHAIPKKIAEKLGIQQ